MSEHTRTVSGPESGTESRTESESDRSSRPLARWILLAVIAVLVALIAGNLIQSRAAASRVDPQSVAMEKALGVRFSRVAVVGDGGLVTVSYVVLDAQQATKFQADSANRPILQSEARDRSLDRVTMMKQGHTLRAGQTYYLVYENPGGALRAGERVTINSGAAHLPHFPVL
jgi:hypothetical protein